MDLATRLRMVRYVDELCAVMRRHLKKLDHHTVDFAWRTAFAMLLAEQIRRDQMFPNEIEAYLNNVFTELRLSTQELLREGDTTGWRRAEDKGA